MGLVKGAMLLWQGAIWLVNTALLANPVTWIVIGIVALVAAVAAAIIYWDQWTSALLNSEAFQWVSGQLTALSDWFGSMGGWAGMASAAWDGIVNIFKQAINGLIEMLNKIPGVQIDAAFGDMPAPPQMPGISAPQVEAPLLPQLVGAAQQPIQAPPLVMAATSKVPAQTAPMLNVLQPQAQAPALVLAPVPKGPAPIAQPFAALEPPRQPPALVLAPPPMQQAEQSQQRINGSVASLSPKRPDAVPRGGLLASIQNNNQTQNKGTHVENVNIHTGKQMNALELEGMLAMAVGG
jgi:hypothetical protein